MVLVVYRSHTGSTKKYAEALAARGGFECIPARKLKDQEGEIVFFGWLRGSQVVGLAGIDRSRLKAVCVVGLDNRFDKASVVSNNKIKCHVYYLRGWFEPKKVNPFERLFIYVVAAVMKLKGLNQHNQPIFDAMMEGGSFYDESALDDVAKFLKLRYRQNPYQPSKPIPFP